MSIPTGSRCLSLATYRDKLQAAWLGQMVGVSYGQPTEFLYRGRSIPEIELSPWRPSQLKTAFYEDDLHVEVGFLDMLSQHGLGVSKEVAARAFAESKTSLWHANGAARERLRGGLAPSWEHSHAHDIDYQIEADFSGLISPGLPARVVALGAFFGGLICNDECVHGGQFMGCLYAEAFFTSDPQELIESGLSCIPEESQYAKTIQDVLIWHRQYPQWQDTWRALESKYNNKEQPRCTGTGTGKEAEGFNISASFNGAYVVMGLLYGEKDPTKTMRLTTSFGQDSDCNASSALGVLFTTIGAAKLPAEYRQLPPNGQTFSGTTYNFARVLEVTEEVTRKNVLLGGGKIERTPNGEEVFLLPKR
jgi:hypothetical protein